MQNDSRNSKNPCLEENSSQSNGYLSDEENETSQSEEQTSSGDTRSKSIVWEFFTRVSAEYSACKCNKRLKTAGPSTSSMMKHIKNKHAEELKAICLERNLPLPGKESTEPETERTERIHKAVDKMFVTDYTPFNIVTRKGFRGVCKALDPSFQLLSSTSYRERRLPRNYQRTRNKIRREIMQDNAR